VANLLSAGFKQYLAAVWLTDTIKVVLIDAGYVYSSAHANLSDVPGGNRVATATLTGKGNTGGVLSAANTPFPALTGNTVTQMWIYKDTGVAGTSTLEIYINMAVNLPLTPTGADEEIDWNAAGIAAL
jgi:hypothetical protein